MKIFVHDQFLYTWWKSEWASVFLVMLTVIPCEFLISQYSNDWLVTSDQGIATDGICKTFANGILNGIGIWAFI